MKPTVKHAAAVLFGVLILPALNWGIQQVPVRHSKEQTGPAAESREQYQKRIQEKLDELGRQISSLEAKEEAQANEARRELRKQLRDLARRHQAAARQYEELKQESQEAWEKTKPKMNAALDELEKAYQNLASRSQGHER